MTCSGQQPGMWWAPAALLGESRIAVLLGPTSSTLGLRPRPLTNLNGYGASSLGTKRRHAFANITKDPQHAQAHIFL